MKKLFSTLALISSITFCKAQLINDSVSVGTGYASQVWYSLDNGVKATSPKNNWDLAFDMTGRGAAIRINSISGITLWGYPKGDTAQWNNVDTAGLSKWTKRWDADTNWEAGAFNRYADPNNPYDLDWGQYNMTTHFVEGDSLYIIRQQDGKYRKLWIESLANNAYTFKYANLDGSDMQEKIINKTSYSTKGFVYYSLQNNTILDREPASADWDLLFTQYTAFIPTAYTVTGVLSNAGVQVAKVQHQDKNTYMDWSKGDFSTAINAIGYDWKTFNGTAYTVQDSQMYFIKTLDGDIWKLVFTGFGGSTTGQFKFAKERLKNASIHDATGSAVVEMTAYPNPSNGQPVNMVYSLNQYMQDVQMNIFDLTGKSVFATGVPGQGGLHQYALPVQQLNPGMYIISLQINRLSTQQKLIIR